MKNLKTVLSTAVIASGALAVSPLANALETDLYGSFRLAVENVQPDDDVALDNYTGFRDAYSRVGGVVSHAFSDTLTASVKLELPLDLANGKVQRPDQENDDVRVFKAQLAGEFGTLWLGKDWMPFYNAIAYPVDYFSSYYSGWTTTTTSRVADTLAYTTPTMNGFSVSAAYSKDAGSDDRTQLTVSHYGDKLTLSAGIDNHGGANDTRVLGLAAGYNNGPWYLTAKVERFISDKATGYGEDGSIAASAMAQYTQGANTYRALIAQFDNYGESIFHAGWDHQLKPNLKLFAEYYYEEETAVIAQERKSTLNVWTNSSGGQVLTAGVRFDF